MPRSASNSATGLERHRRAAVGMDGELAVRGMSCRAQISAISFSASLAELRDLAFLHHPTDDIPAEHVEDHVQVEVGPLRGPQQLG